LADDLRLDALDEGWLLDDGGHTHHHLRAGPTRPVEPVRPGGPSRMSRPGGSGAVAEGWLRRDGTGGADDLVHQAVVFRLFGGEPAVAVGVVLDLLDALTGVERGPLLDRPLGVH